VDPFGEASLVAAAAEDGGEETIEVHHLPTLDNRPPPERHTTFLILTTKDGLRGFGLDWRVVRQPDMDWVHAEVAAGLKRGNNHGITRGPIWRIRLLLNRVGGLVEGIRSREDGLVGVGVRHMNHRPVVRVQVDAIGMIMGVLGVRILALDSGVRAGGSLRINSSKVK